MTYPSTLIPTLAPVVLFRRTLPLPSTHPFHPAASGILSTLKEAQKGYADMRGNWSVKCLEGQGKRLVAGAETIDSLTTGRGFTEWVELTLGTSEVCDRQIVCPNSHYLFNRKNTNFWKNLVLYQALKWLRLHVGFWWLQFLKLLNSIFTYATPRSCQDIITQIQLPRVISIGLLSLQPHWNDLFSS